MPHERVLNITRNNQKSVGRIKVRLLLSFTIKTLSLRTSKRPKCRILIRFWFFIDFYSSLDDSLGGFD